jgi:hypothetical protein
MSEACEPSAGATAEADGGAPRMGSVSSTAGLTPASCAGLEAVRGEPPAAEEPVEASTTLPFAEVSGLLEELPVGEAAAIAGWAAGTGWALADGLERPLSGLGVAWASPLDAAAAAGSCEA